MTTRPRHSRPAIHALLLIGVLCIGNVAAAMSPSLEQTGKKLFIRCSACHALRADAPPLIGPHLEAILKRRAASVAGFEYSEPMQRQKFRWNKSRLDKFLKSPQADIPDLCLPFLGFDNPEDRKALIAYLIHPSN
jgi:cytochrome c